jgi:hypothetical protein
MRMKIWTDTSKAIQRSINGVLTLKTRLSETYRTLQRNYMVQGIKKVRIFKLISIHGKGLGLAVR